MSTFIWNDLTVTVGEMSRAAALSCARDFQAISGLFSDEVSLLSELDALAAVYAPCVVKNGATIINSTTQIGDFTLTLPLTREAFDSLPFSLTHAWIEAAIDANNWLVDDLKKVFGLMTTNESVPPSGSAPSSEPIKASPTTTTTGQANIQ